VTLKSLKMTRKKRNEIIFSSFVLLVIIPIEAYTGTVNGIGAFNSSLEQAGNGLEKTSEIVIKICKIIAGIAAVVGLISFIIYKSGDNDVSGKVGRWAAGVLLFSIGMGVVTKVFL